MAAGHKTGGRMKGTPNKVTGEVRETFRLLLEGNVSRMQNWLDAVASEDPAKALDVLTKLAEFVVPKLARSELTGPDGGPAPIVPIINVSLHRSPDPQHDPN